MIKRTTFEFEGKTGYTYVCKAYSGSDVKFEVHFRVNENETDCIQFGVESSSARNMLRSLTRAVIESDKELGLDCLTSVIDEHKEKLEEYAASQE